MGIEVKHIFICLLVILISSFVNYLFTSFAHFFPLSCCLFLLICESYLYILHMSSLLDITPGLSQYAQVVLLREDNGTPLQYSCLENPMDGGAL